MRIFYFHQHFTIPSKSGGTRSYEFAQKLIKRGHSVIMVCGKAVDLNLSPTENNNIYRGMIDGIDVIQISLPYSNKDSIAKRIVTFVKFAMIGIKIAYRENYDILFATSTPLTSAIPGIIMKLLRKKKFVFEVRDLWPDLPRALGMINPILLGGMKLLESCSYYYADACIALSPGISAAIKRRSPEGRRVIMIPNGCDLKIFHPMEKEKIDIKGIGSDDIVALFMGAHGVANGLNAVLDVAKVLKRRGRDDIKLLFIGDGKMKPSLMQRAEKENLDNCIFHNPIAKVHLNKIVASSDIGLMILANVPAFYYGTSPNKFFDYISSGIAVVNNYPGWLADIIVENSCGIAVRPDDPDAFADALIFLSDNPHQRESFGINGRKLAEREFDRNLLADKFVDFLESVYNA